MIGAKKMLSEMPSGCGERHETNLWQLNMLKKKEELTIPTDDSGFAHSSKLFPTTDVLQGG